MAYDFSAVCESGQMLYYNITSRTAPYTVEVTTFLNYNESEIIGGDLSEYPNSYYSYCGSINIPEQVSYSGVSYSVSKIGYGAFFSCSGLTSITIPNSVNSIGDYAFKYCEGLTSINIPNSVTNIGLGAFYGCSGLNSVTIPNYVTSIGDVAFSHCRGLISIIIGNSVTSIGLQTFYGCSGLTSITIPNSVTRIEQDAFCGCSGLSSIAIPNSVTHIGQDVFLNTSWYDNQPDGLLYLDGWCLGCKGDAPTGSISIAEGTKGIAGAAFGDLSLTEIHLPNSLVYFSKYVFGKYSSIFNVADIIIEQDNTNFRIVDNVLFNYDMTKLIMSMRDFNATAYSVPSTVTRIEDYAFYGCSGLTGSLTIPNSVTSIGVAAFENCSGMTSITIPNSVTSIERYAFQNCSELVSVIIPNSVTSIGYAAFYNCRRLESIRIPESVTSIGRWAFSSCDNLTSVYYMGDIATWCKILFDGHTSNPLSYAHNLYVNNELLTDLVIPQNVTAIKCCTFDGATCLTSVSIPNSVTSIGDCAFCGCSGLTGLLTIPNSVTSIERYAFQNCSELVSVIIPNSVASIGGDAFSGTRWYNNQPDGILYLDGWCLGYKGEKPTGSLEIASGTKGIAGWGFVDCDEITSVNIPISVTKIGAAAFGGNGFSSVTIGNSVEEIDAFAFAFNENLDSVSIGSSLEKIGHGVFVECSNLKSVSILAPEPIDACNLFTAPDEHEMFVSAGENMRLYVPCGTLEAYATSSWSEWFSDIREMPDCASVEENEVEDLLMFPNPVCNTLNIFSSETISTIEIVNALGQVVYRTEVNSENAVCDVEGLVSGVYVVRIHSRSLSGVEGSATLSQRRFVKE